jgi:hypothetical protein
MGPAPLTPLFTRASANERIDLDHLPTPVGETAGLVL